MRDLAAQRRVARPVDLAHAAGAEQAGDFERADPGSGGHTQRRVTIP